MPQIHIKVDTNDADYVTEVSTISEEDLAAIRPLVEAIKNFKPYVGLGWNHPHNYPYGDCLRKDLGELPPEKIYKDFEDEVYILESYLPCCEYGFHTIEEIMIYPDTVGEKLL